MSGTREAGGGSPIEQVADKLAITELLYRYAELIDAGDFDGVGVLLGRATFTGTKSPRRRPGGDIEPVTSGAEVIAKLFATTTRRFPDAGNTPRTRHLVLNPIVEIANDGTTDTAVARSTFCVLQATETVPLQPIVVGRYFDCFRRDETGWFFTERKIDVEMVGDVSAHLMFDPQRFDR